MLLFYPDPTLPLLGVTYVQYGLERAFYTLRFFGKGSPRFMREQVLYLNLTSSTQKMQLRKLDSNAHRPPPPRFSAVVKGRGAQRFLITVVIHVNSGQHIERIISHYQVGLSQS